MKNKKSVAVWLLYTDGSDANKFLLQKRVKTELIDGVIKNQSHTGVCQPTWNEKVEEGEELLDAVKRGAKEELGERFANAFDFSQLNLFNSEGYSFENTESTSYNFLGKVTADILALVKLHAGAEPHFITVGKEDFSKVKSKNDKTADLVKDVVLFEDQYQALKKLSTLKEVFDNTK